HNGNAPAFQAVYVGSIPSTRSNLSRMFFNKNRLLAFIFTACNACRRGPCVTTERADAAPEPVSSEAGMALALCAQRGVS
ncbi:MAG: hypothetical protein ACO33A_09345, partial [Hyphomonas sp.]